MNVPCRGQQPGKEANRGRKDEDHRPRQWPFLVKGAVNGTDADGSKFRAERATDTLCHCGGSETKPLCDGTHSRLGFRAAERAVREKGERD